MSEATRRQAIREALTRRGYLVVAYPAGPFGRKGTSDLLVCAMGRFVALEIKDDDGRESPAQAAFGAQVVRAGGFYAVVRTREEALEGVERALRETPRREFFA